MDKWLVTTFRVGNKQVNIWWYANDPDNIEVECLEFVYLN